MRLDLECAGPAGAPRGGLTLSLSAHLLLVDDDPLIREGLALGLEPEFDVHTAATRPEALAQVARARARPSGLPWLALVDLGLPPLPHRPDEGLALIRELSERHAEVRTLVLTGQSERANIQAALAYGAVDFLPKPVDTEVLRARLMHHAHMLRAESAAPVVDLPNPALLLGTSPQMHKLKGLIAQFSSMPYPVLITGESGVGKELVARALHGSETDARPFRAINCAALPGELLEAQLFGAARGAFTGAVVDQIGFFEAAAGGTLLLDEVAELPLPLQAKLLRVLENGEYYRLGQTTPRRAAVRVVAATNRDLVAAVSLGQFREDLFHRLNVLALDVPPLRARREDVRELFASFLARLHADVALDDGAWARLLAHDFPGNVRELKNIAVRISAKYPRQIVDAPLLSEELGSQDARVCELTSERTPSQSQALIAEIERGNFSLDRTLLQLEEDYINAALGLSDGRLAGAARLLGLNRSTLYSRMERLRRLKP